METLNRDNLSRKKMPELKSMIRALGADSPHDETKESLINRILLFTPPETAAPPTEPSKPVSIPAVTPEALKAIVSPYMEKGLAVSCDGKCWHFAYNGRQDSGTLSMPPKIIQWCAEMMMQAV